MSPFTLEDAVTALRAMLTGLAGSNGPDRPDRPDRADRVVEAEARVDALDPALHPGERPSLLASALWYAEQGLRVFPLTPGAKIPLARSRGFKDATTDAAQIRAWWEQTPDANIGIATGHLVDVVDVDGPTGQKSRCEHWDDFAALVALGVVTTPRAGGMHLYVPATGRGNKTNLFGSVDYRGLGGYVVAPRSRTDRGEYRWITPLDLSAAEVAS